MCSSQTCFAVLAFELCVNEEEVVGQYYKIMNMIGAVMVGGVCCGYD